MPDDIECITTCPALNELELDSEIDSEDNCAHSKGIEYSTGTRCEMKCRDGFLISHDTISCLESGEWSVSPADLECAIAKAPVPSSAPIETTRERIQTPEQIQQPNSDTENVGAAKIAVPICILFIIVAAVVFFLYRRKRHKKTRHDGNGAFDASKGGDELDTLLDKRPLNLSRNSRHSTSVPTSSIPEDKLDSEFTRRMADDKNVMMQEYDMIPTTTHASTATASKNANANKNRYKNILPYDSDRVSLKFSLFPKLLYG